MSITKGAMLISNANAVGAELVNKLGGTGYKPVEWADKINLLGIRDDDKASALAGITSGTYTGDERGAIHYSNCNAVGAMLNKKFSTDRGFKPVEWESAISKLTPLAEGTVSGSVVSFPNGADDVPTKSLIVTIPPTLSGVSSVSCNKGGSNFIELYTRASNNGIDYSINADGSLHRYGTATANSFNNASASNYANCPLKLKKGTYTLSIDGEDLDANTYTVIGGWTESGTQIANQGKTATGTITFTVNEDFGLWYYVKLNSGTQVNDDVYIWLNAGLTAHAYEPYTAPTTYTASLGRTIYGGQADIVNGTGEETWKSVKLKDLDWTYSTAYSGFFHSASLADTISGEDYIVISSEYTNMRLNASAIQNNDDVIDVNADNGNPVTGAVAFKSIILKDSDYTTKEALVAHLTSSDSTLVYKVATPTGFTFTGQEVPTRLGYNAFWSDQGDTEVTYRKDPDIPDPPEQLLNMNNENNENNDN